MEWIFLMEVMMNKIKIFLAAPISGFKDEIDYKKNRNNILDLINELSDKFEIYSEIFNISSLTSYDEPGESAIKDFNKISESDIFMMYHPIKMQTSTLIELGYAVAKDKKIIIISNPQELPYLALGLSKYNSGIKIVPFSDLNDIIIEQIKTVINDFIH